MKGLLLKDWYMIKSYCRAYLLIAAIFLAVSTVSDSNTFYAVYPCMLFGMIPINLLAYDERSRWLQYCGALPYTRAQLVSSKYLIGLIAQLSVLAVSVCIQAVRMTTNGGFRTEEFLVFAMMSTAVSLLAPAISLPLIFKLGVEKGRIAYLVVLGMICGGSIIAVGMLSKGSVGDTITLGTPLLAVFIVAVALYVLSWRLSISFFKNREL